MRSVIFLMLGLLFFWLVYHGISTGKVLAKGWGFRFREYHRDTEPTWYWVTMTTHLICAIAATAFALLSVNKSFF